MEKQRNIKILSIVALVLAIAGMSLGFAAFSATLNISSATSVSPNSSDFNVVFCNESILGYCEDKYWNYFIACSPSGGAECNSSATIDDLHLTDLTAKFTEPNQKVNYMFDVQNLGQYDAYLRGVTYNPLDNGSYIKCTASTNDSTTATDSLVRAACEGIKVTVKVGGIIYDLGTTNISGHKLSKQTTEEVNFIIEYESGSPLADGPFNVEIADIKFDYSTMDGESNLITFTIDGTVYYAEQGMTWREWVQSSYSENKYLIHNNYVLSKYGVCETTIYENAEDVIEAINYEQSGFECS